MTPPTDPRPRVGARVSTAQEHRSAAGPGAAPVVVLHVTEALGGGVMSAVTQMARTLTMSTQHLLYRPRRDEDTGVTLADCFATVTEFQTLASLARAIESVAGEVRPDVIHLHSTWAGVLGRVRRSRPAPVVYSPHGFYFENRGLPAVVRWGAWGVERLLTQRADLLVCVSPYERRRAEQLGARSAYVPNTVPPPVPIPRPRPSLDPPGPRTHKVLTVGRVTGAKDPEFFARVVDLVGASRSDVRWTWVGAGDHRLERRLAASGVQITGWLPREQVFDRLRGADLYVHTAAWESNPMAPLEASAYGVPVIVRSIPALVSVGHPAGLLEPADVARAIDGHLSGETPAEPAAVPSADEQWRALTAAYSLARRRYAAAGRGWRDR